MYFPAVEYRVGIPIQVRRRGRGDLIVKGFAVTNPADHDTGLAVAGEQHAQPAWVEVKPIDLRQAGKWMPHENDRSSSAVSRARRGMRSAPGG